MTQNNEGTKVHMLVLQPGGDFRQYEHRSEDEFRGFGAAGKACLSGIDNSKPAFPTQNEMLKMGDGTRHLTISRFDQEAGGELTPEGLKQFKRACERYQSECDSYEKNGNGDLTRYFLHSLSPDIRLTLGLRQDWNDACSEPITNNFAKWQIIKSIYASGTAKLRNQRFRTFLALKQETGESYSVFADKVHNGALSMAYNFQSSIHPGFIKLDDIKLLVFLTGLHSVDFKFFLDKWYVDHPDGSILTADEVMTSAAIYAREHIEEASMNQYAASLLTKSVGSVSKLANGTKLVCSTCGVNIETILSKSGNPYSKCNSCFQKVVHGKQEKFRAREEQFAKFRAREELERLAARPGPVVPKTSQSTRTVLRANVASTTPPTPSIAYNSDDGTSEDD